jgi:hypothetical protein
MGGQRRDCNRIHDWTETTVCEEIHPYLGVSLAEILRVRITATVTGPLAQILFQT